MLVDLVFGLWEILALFQSLSFHTAQFYIFFKIVQRLQTHRTCAYRLFRRQVACDLAHNRERVEKLACRFGMLPFFKVGLDILAEKCLNKITASRVLRQVIFDVVDNSLENNDFVIGFVFEEVVVDCLLIWEVDLVRVRVFCTWSVAISHD